MDATSACSSSSKDSSLTAPPFLELLRWPVVVFLASKLAELIEVDESEASSADLAEELLLAAGC